MTHDLSIIERRLQRGDIAGALPEIAEAQAANPNDRQTALLAAEICKAAGQFDQAELALAPWVERSDCEATTHNLMGNIQRELGRLEQADHQYGLAISKDPALAPAVINRGRLASQRMHHRRAISLLEKAVEMTRNSELARISLGNALRAAGQQSRSKEVLESVIHDNPAKVNAQFYLGATELAANRCDRAIEIFQRAERNGLKAPELYDNLAAAFLQKGKVEQAHRRYRDLVAAFPAYFPGHTALARLVAEYELDEEPFSSLFELSRNFAGEPSVWETLATSLQGSGRFPEVLNIVAEARTKRIETNTLAMAEAVAFSETGKTGKATEKFEKLQIDNADNADFLLSLSRHWLRTGAARQAETSATRAVEIRPSSQFGWAYLGTAWRLMDDERENWLHDYDAHIRQIEVVPDGPRSKTHEQYAVEVAAVLRGFHSAKCAPMDQSLRGGTQTHGALLHSEHKGIAKFRSALEAAISDYIYGLPQPESGHPLLSRISSDFEFAGSWSVRLFRQGFHVPHVHEAGWLSTAYHAILPSRHTDEPDAGKLALGQPPQDLGLNLPPRRIIEPKEGTVVIFPSSMWHGTLPFSSDEERLAAAFDIIPV